MQTIIPEEAFQQSILNLAEIFGWLVYHTYDSRRSREGFPDLVLVRRGRLVFAEVKSESGRLSREQGKWLEELTEVERYSLGNVKARVWRPSDWAEIESILGR